MWMVYIGVPLVAALLVARRFVYILQVNEGTVGLLYVNGRMGETLPPGVHVRAGWQIQLLRVDTRTEQTVLPSQELLTSDNVTIRVTLVADHRVVDPVQASQATQYWQQHLYSFLQIALRDALVKRTFDEVVGDREEIAKEIHAAVVQDAAALGVEVSRVAVRDVMITAELRRAFAEAVRLREEGKAALEKARAETAALRSLANAARMLREHPELLSVRRLQFLDAVAANHGNTLVLGVPPELSGLRQADMTTPAEPQQTNE
jgi:regulator of protease activity HflC (stomatin/prohibitin superfamily)